MTDEERKNLKDEWEQLSWERTMTGEGKTKFDLYCEAIDEIKLLREKIDAADKVIELVNSSWSESFNKVLEHYKALNKI